MSHVDEKAGAAAREGAVKRIARAARSISLAGLLCLGAAAAAAGEEEAAAQAPAEAGAGAKPDWTRRPDFAALRSEWGAREDFGERCEHQRPMRESFELLSTDQWSELLELATPWAERCPVDMEAHVLRAIALEHLGRAEEAEDHRLWMRGLFEAVLATGDGKTPETAYQVIAVYEEYSLLRFFRYEAKGQALVSGGVDALSVIADGEKRTVYFNATPSFLRMQQELRAGPRDSE